MSDLVLYNYALSPFSEKIRLMLGYTGAAWRSVKVPETPPRPGLEVLAGGYRKIPVMQVGADVYCDSKAIAAELARRSGRPELAVENSDEAVQDFVRHAELEAFTAVLIGSPLGVLNRIRRETSTVNMLRFVVDRIGIGRTAKVPRMSGGQAKATLGRFFADVETRLAGDFLFGDRPGAADFSAYTVFFFAELADRIPKDAPRTLGWASRMRAFGHGAVSELGIEQALDAAKAAAPAPLPPGESIGEPAAVSIAPADYARNPVTGLLVAENAHRWTLRREHPNVGVVHVHFPKAGFSLRSAS